MDGQRHAQTLRALRTNTRATCQSFECYASKRLCRELDKFYRPRFQPCAVADKIIRTLGTMELLPAVVGGGLHRHRAFAILARDATTHTDLLADRVVGYPAGAYLPDNSISQRCDLVSAVRP